MRIKWTKNGQWKPKLLTHWRLDSKSHRKWKWKIAIAGWSKLRKFQLIMVPVCTRDNVKACSWCYSQTWNRASVSSWTVRGTTWRWRMNGYMTSQRFSICCSSGEHEGQSMASMPLSGAAYTLWSNEVGHCPAPGSPLHQRKVWQWVWGFHLTAFRVPLASRWRFVRPSKDMPPQTITDQHQNGHAEWCCRQHNLCNGVSRLFSLDLHLSRANCEPALICEENMAPMVNQSILVFSSKCQSRLHGAGLWAHIN